MVIEQKIAKRLANMLGGHLKMIPTTRDGKWIFYESRGEYEGEEISYLEVLLLIKDLINAFEERDCSRRDLEDIAFFLGAEVNILVSKCAGIDRLIKRLT